MNGTKINYKKLLLAVIIALVVISSANALLIKLITKEPAWVQTKKEEEKVIYNWQKYHNKEFNFSFQYPPETKLVSCWNNDCVLNVMFGSEIFKEIVAVRNIIGPTKRYFMGVLVKTDLSDMSLREYVKKQREIIKNVSLNNRKTLGQDLNIDFVIKDIEVDKMPGYVIETVSSDKDGPSRRFFIPLGNKQVLLILEIDRNIDNVLSKFKIGDRARD